MGEFRMGPPSSLVIELARNHELGSFVETGTYRGDTTAWASEHFESVVTIEFSRALYERASKRLSAHANVRALFGDSRERLAEVVPALHSPALFWLDAHWCSGETYGVVEQCPLLEEIAIIKSATVQHFILIDDARFFLSPQPAPNRPEQWPTAAAVFSALSANTELYVVVVEDVIVAVPREASPAVTRYCQRVNSSLRSRRLTPLVQDVRFALKEPLKAIKKAFSS